MRKERATGNSAAMGVLIMLVSGLTVFYACTASSSAATKTDVPTGVHIGFHGENFNGIYMASLLFAAPVSAEEVSDLTAPGATITEIRSNFSFTEGPAADAEGNVYFSDMRTGRIYKWAHENNTVSLMRENTNSANGLMFDPKGRLIICEMATGSVTMDDGSGKIEVIADSYEGKKLHSPNDLWVDPQGGIYFSDYAGGRGNSQSDTLHVYYISPDHENLLQVTDAFVRPNGVVGSMDGKHLYIADSGDQKIWRYDIQPGGLLTGKRSFVDQYADGMTIDERENLYLAGRDGVAIYNSNGERIGLISTPQSPTNVTFCGKDFNTLFITARTSIYTIKMKLKGGSIHSDK